MLEPFRSRGAIQRAPFRSACDRLRAEEIREVLRVFLEIGQGLLSLHQELIQHLDRRHVARRELGVSFAGLLEIILHLATECNRG